MKRWMSLLLSLALLGGLGVPAVRGETEEASETADERLARVTASVKETLDLDTDAYTEFYGDLSEQELGVLWDLNWSGDGRSMNVEALEDGTVVNYRVYDGNDSYSRYGSGLSTFPKLDTAAAKAAAERFLARVLDAETERVELAEPTVGRLGSTNTSFSGTILLNGLPSPLTYTITVRGSDNQVTAFYRSAVETSFLGNIPSATPSVEQDAAASTLRDALDLEVIYVGTEEHQAALRYVRKGNPLYAVDAQTGDLVETGGHSIFATPNAEMAAEEADAGSSSGSGRRLTEVELSGVQRMEGVQTSEALDALLRAESAYKLDDLTLRSTSYYLSGSDDEEETVLCSLRYQDEEGMSYRYFTVDARSGAVRSLNGYEDRDRNQPPAYTAEAAEKTAREFLSRFTSYASEFELHDTADNTENGASAYSFTFARTVNGYPFPENACTLQVSCMTGAITGISYTYDEKAVFESAEGLIDLSAALDAWMAAHDVTLGYRSYSRELDPAVPVEARLIEWGMTHFYSLFLSYGLERETALLGIDAKTGEAISEEKSSSEIRYDDLSGSWAEAEIRRLADYGVGYEGGSFRPDAAITQWELVCLLASARGMRLDPDHATDDERDSAYNQAYYMGALKRADRRDDAALTRGEVIRMLLNSAGYASVAKLTGIFTCSYSDGDSIPADDYGYAALAQGLGLVRGAYQAETPCSRAVAAVLLCRLLDRDT